MFIYLHVLYFDSFVTKILTKTVKTPNLIKLSREATSALLEVQKFLNQKLICPFFILAVNMCGSEFSLTLNAGLVAL